MLMKLLPFSFFFFENKNMLGTTTVKMWYTYMRTALKLDCSVKLFSCFNFSVSLVFIVFGLIQA